ncbi:uncharacterized protein LOC129557882 isoform X2 [Moschus berezovskii]|uniref:uncharacterized protein LOC129557882 isoform X2 n=1 Tax=Moschus berezovskii TaxID=68408 RepID=UPI002443B248|nr:uncharacterized protein LOC129557882 isoform X2 [Moschus berezovskii]
MELFGVPWPEDMECSRLHPGTAFQTLALQTPQFLQIEETTAISQQPSTSRQDPPQQKEYDSLEGSGYLSVTPFCFQDFESFSPSKFEILYQNTGFLYSTWSWSISSQLLQQGAAAVPYLGRGVSPQGRPSRFECGSAPLGPPVPKQPPPPGRGTAPLGHRPNPGRGVAPLSHDSARGRLRRSRASLASAPPEPGVSRVCAAGAGRLSNKRYF